MKVSMKGSNRGVSLGKGPQGLCVLAAKEKDLVWLDLHKVFAHEAEQVLEGMSIENNTNKLVRCHL